MQRDTYRETALHVGAREGYCEIVKLLLGASADVESTDDDGRTPLSCAAANGHLAVVEFLVKEARADVESKDSIYGRTPLSWAAANGHLEVVEFLVDEGGADVESKDSIYGRTPLSCAAMNGHLEVVEFLVKEAGADVESKDNNGNTALDLARRDGWGCRDPEGRKAVAAWLEGWESETRRRPKR